MGINNLPVHAMNSTTEQVIEVDRVTYYIISYKETGKNIVELRTSNNDDYYTYMLDTQNQIIEFKTHILQDTGEFKTNTEIIDTSIYVEENDEISTLAIGYGSKVNCKLGDCWYQTGSEGTKTYLKIGCTATY